jgi:lauroyl/myristoyl acyltransferase
MKRLALFLFLSLAVLSGIQAQWYSKTYSLAAGWNGIWLHGDASYTTVAELFASNTNITEVWRWNPNPDQIQFTSSPSTPNTNSDEWTVWKRNDATEQVLQRMVASSAYLINNAGSATTITIKQQARSPANTWLISGSNFMGFPSAGTSSSWPILSNYFASFINGSNTGLPSGTQVYKYVGGALSGSNPLQVVNTTERLDPAQAGFASACRLFMNQSENFSTYSRLSTRPTSEVVDMLGFRQGFEHLQRARDGGQGCLLVTGHLGFFELGGLVMAQLGFPMTALTLPEPSTALTEWRADFRARWGVETIVVGNHSFSVLDIVRSLQNGAFVASLADRPYDGNSVAVDLPHGRIRFSTGPVLLALLAGCPIVPVGITRQPDGRHERVLESDPGVVGATIVFRSVDDETAPQRLARLVPEPPIEPCLLLGHPTTPSPANPKASCLASRATVACRLGDTQCAAAGWPPRRRGRRSSSTRTSAMPTTSRRCWKTC